MTTEESPRRVWVPGRYLQVWAAKDTAIPRESRVWRIACVTREATLLPIDRLLPEGDEPDSVSSAMLQRMEALLAPTLREVIVPQKAFTPEDRVFLAFLASAMLARSPELRDNWQGEWQQILEQMQRKERIRKTLYSPALVQGWATVMSGDSPSFTMKHGEALATPNVHRMLPPTMRGIGRLLSRMSISVLTSESLPFITSDTPCVMVDAAAAAAHASARHVTELASPAAQVQLPLAPDRLLNFSWREEVDGRYLPVADDAVDAANRTTRLHAQTWLVSSFREVRDTWFK
jgi:hypothetical protein